MSAGTNGVAVIPIGSDEGLDLIESLIISFGAILERLTKIKNNPKFEADAKYLDELLTNLGPTHPLYKRIKDLRDWCKKMQANKLARAAAELERLAKEKEEQQNKRLEIEPETPGPSKMKNG